MTEDSDKAEALRVHDAIHDEHIQVRAIARQMTETSEVSVLLPLLREHRGMLRHHFASEEATGGLYEVILQMAPERAHNLEALRTQHEALLLKIDKLCDAGESGAVLTDEEVQSQARVIARDLADHETEESGLLLEVMNTDLGTGD